MKYVLMAMVGFFNNHAFALNIEELSFEQLYLHGYKINATIVADQGLTVPAGQDLTVTELGQNLFMCPLSLKNRAENGITFKKGRLISFDSYNSSHSGGSTSALISSNDKEIDFMYADVPRTFKELKTYCGKNLIDFTLVPQNSEEIRHFCGVRTVRQSTAVLEGNGESLVLDVRDFLSKIDNFIGLAPSGLYGTQQGVRYCVNLRMNGSVPIDLISATIE